MYTEDTFENAAVAFRKLKARALALPEDGTVDEVSCAPYKKAFSEALENDLNTSLAVTAVYDVLKAKDLSGAAKRALLEDFDRVLSLDLLKAEEQKVAPAAGVDAAEIEKLIAERAAAKKAKNYAEADRIRAYLAEKGVTLVDTPSGTTYKIG